MITMCCCPLGREGLLPKPLGRTHPKFKSPYIASVVQSVVAAVIIILFAVFTATNDPSSQAYLQLYGLMAVMGVIIILSVQALVSLAIQRECPRGALAAGARLA